MQPLLLMKQTIEKPFDPGGLAIDGPIVRFTQAEQFLSDSRTRTFSVRFWSRASWIQFIYGRSGTEGVDILAMGFSVNNNSIRWENNQTLTKEMLSQAIAVTDYAAMAALDFVSPNQLRVVRDRMTLAAAGVGLDTRSLDRPIAFYSPATAIIDQLQSILHLPGLRGNPERHYAISAAGPSYPGNFNDYVASVIHQWETCDDGKLKKLEADLKYLGLTSRLTTRTVDDTRVEVRVGRLPAPARGGMRDTVNIADVGFGVSQTLPVLVALLAAAPDQIVSIEQPELHLHPRAQGALAEIILQAVNRGVRVVIETHSSLLLLALQAAIAEGRISPNRVSLNWFTRDSTGQTHVTEAQIGEDGSYGDWPEDFGSTDLELQDRYVTVVERRHAGR
jgi:hypothetical protein